ncbi:MAG: hypothetical protein ABIG20_04750 [archaeon]
MSETIIVQKGFRNLKEFIAGQNNFYAYFLKGNDWGEIRRRHPWFKRFQKEHPELEKALVKAVGKAVKERDEYPYEQLFEAYKLMSEMVHSGDFKKGRYKEPSRILIS